MAEPVHGIHSTYTNHRCRCAACRAANREYLRAYYAADPERLELKRQASRDGMRRLRARRRAEADGGD